MKEKLKKFINSKLFIFIITALIFSTVGASATTLFPSNNVTYDNKTSGLKSNNVQGAIDELYNTCLPPIAGDQILDNIDIVTTGDGLYKDEYEDGRYFYKGKNVNNYINFNNETWRIVSIEPDKTIKIMRNAALSEIAWDSLDIVGNNNWARPADLNVYLNEEYLQKSLNATAQSQIFSKDWSIGAITYENNNLVDQIADENSRKWNGKVALITVSEYIRSNSNQSSCGTFSKNNNNYNNCKNTTWMFNSSLWWWTLTPFDGYSDRVLVVVGATGTVGNQSAGTANPIRPVVYLSSQIKITRGNGSQSNPYQIQ